MPSLRDIIREVHHRSLWQVLGVYLLGGWGALEAVQFLTEQAGLPPWLPAFALALLIIGLPIVVATAVVQEGGPEWRGGEASEVMKAGASGAPPSPGLQRIFTWRNAVVGGVGAFAICGVVAAGWLLLGAGPNPGAATEPPSPPGGENRSIAVLPFADMSPAGDQEYFGDGLAEEILNALARMPELHVAARTSAFSFKGKDVDIREIGRTLQVATVLEGSVRKAGDRVRVTAQLIDVESGYHIWSDTYERRLVDIFAVQDDISRSIVRALALAYTGGQERALVRATTGSPEAYEHYLRGRYHWNKRTRAGLDAAIAEFARAIDLDSAYAAAWVGLAESYALLPWYSPDADPASDLGRAAEAAERALALDPDLAEAHAPLGWVRLFKDYDWAGAEGEFLRVLELNAAYPTARHWYSILLSFQGRHAEAIEQARAAVERDPLSLVINTQLANVLLAAGQLEAAADQYQRTTRLDPNHPTAWLRLAQTYQLSDRGTEGADALAQWAEVTGQDPDLARTTMRWVADRAAGGGTGPPPPFESRLGLTSGRIAMIYALARDRERTLAWLERAAAERSPELLRLKSDPAFAFLRGDSRYDALVRKTGLAD